MAETPVQVVPDIAPLVVERQGATITFNPAFKTKGLSNKGITFRPELDVDNDWENVVKFYGKDIMLESLVRVQCQRLNGYVAEALDDNNQFTEVSRATVIQNIIDQSSSGAPIKEITDTIVRLATEELPKVASDPVKREQVINRIVALKKARDSKKRRTKEDEDALAEAPAIV